MKRSNSKRLHNRTTSLSSDGGSPMASAPNKLKKEASVKGSLDKLYANKEQLLCIFRFFDTDSSGTIDKDEFEVGMKVMFNIR